MSITKADLQEATREIKETVQHELEIRFAGLPCKAHDERMDRIQATAGIAEHRADEAQATVGIAQAKADAAFSAASGNIWHLAKLGFVALCASLGLKLSNAAHVLLHIAQK